MAVGRTICAGLTFLGLMAPAAHLYAQQCTGFDASTHAGNIANESIGEASGLSASWRHEGLLWTHNDSGDKARLFLLEADGTHVATVDLDGVAKATDWEDMAVGPCDKGSTKSCVFVADIGDNRAKRDAVVIHRFEEPDLPADLPAEIRVSTKEHIWFQYPGGARDAETVMIHPSTGAIYVVEKRVKGASGFYRVPRQAETSQKTNKKKSAKKKPNQNKKSSKKKPFLAVEVGQLRFEANSGFGNMITAGDISPDGSEFTVRTYLGVYTFCADGDDFETAVETTPTRSKPPFMIQSEALGYARDGNAIWVTSERRPSPLYRMERQGEQPEAEK